MDKTTWLFYAFATVWIGLGAYLTTLLLRIKRLERRVRQIETIKQD